jgi:hypothetical protein
MTFPVTTNLDDSLTVEVHLHEFFLGDRDRQCWTYLTHGLAANSSGESPQREMALSLLIDDGGDVEDFPRTPIKMFQLLNERVAEGKLVDFGDSTRLGQRGIFGFPGLFYVPAIQYGSLPNLDNYLGLILVHQSEYDYARQYGLTRFLSRLGRYCSSFPYPTWNTQERPSLFPEASREISVLADASHVLVEHSYVHQFGEVLQFQLHQTDAITALNALQYLEADQMAIFNTAFSSRCDASLYWQEGQDSPGAYAAPEATTGMIGGSFISLGIGDSGDITIVEDGYGVTLEAGDWQRMIYAIEHQESFGCHTATGRRFIVDFVDNIARPRARKYEPVAVWRKLSTDQASQIILPKKIAALPFINLSGENALWERVSSEELDAYINRIEAMLTDALSEEQDSFQLDIGLTVSPGKLDVTTSASIELNPEFSSFINKIIGQIKPCAVTSQIKFRIPLIVNPEN